MKFRFGSSKSTTDPAQVIGDDADQVSASGREVPLEIEEKVTTAPSHAQLSDDQAARKLRLFREAAIHDPNLPTEDIDRVDDAVDAHNVDKENILVEDLMENSPYPEVRASVRNYDVDLPANTIRAWFIGMLMTTIFSALNTLFSLRNPSIIVTSIVAQLVAYPLGMGWSYVMPNRQFSLFGLKFNFNPGPFNFKEHALIVLMANAAYGGGSGYFTLILTAQNAWYKLNWGWGYAILLGLTTQCVGFGLAGLARKFVVEPANMIWPVMLVNSSFMYTLHDHSKTDPAKTNGWSVSRYRYFSYVLLGAFCWYWFPGFIFQALSIFTFPTWIAPNNVIVNQVFGGSSGMALLPLTFDWTQITAFIYSPLIPPFHALANTAIGVVFFFWILAPALHFSGTWYAEYLPFFDNGSWDNTQKPYNVTRILTPDFQLDLAKYEAYSPLFLSTTFALCYGLSFAAIIAVIVNTVIFNGKEIYNRFRDREGVLDDIHMKMMRKYIQVPWWWFGILFLVFTALSFVTCYVWPTGLEWWALIIALLISAVWIVPIAMIQAVTNIQIGLNVFTEFLVGYMLPGRPNAMMMFKTYGYISMSQGVAFLQDMKLGHYLKLPPRTMFFGQVIATIWSVVVQVATYYWTMSNFKDICTPEATAGFTCPGGKVFFTASVIWGLIGPQRIFSGTGLYTKLQYFWIIGAALPVILWLLLKRWPKSFLRYVNIPVILSGNANIPPATPMIYMSWFIVGTIFNKWIRSRWTGWWLRFNYITSAALDSGLVIATTIIVLTLSLTNTQPPQWWGNVGGGAFDTMDAQGTAIQTLLGDGETFGPPVGSW